MSSSDAENVEITPDAGAEPAPADEGEPDNGDPEVVALKQELDDAWKVSNDRLEQLQRFKADYENLKQRTERERLELQDRIAARIVEKLLPVIDEFELALKAATAQPGAESVVAGVDLVLRRFQEALSQVGVERMEAEGSEFDPHEHEAVSSVPGDVAVATVTAVIRPGYRLKGKPLRPAMVMVTTPAESADEASEEQD